MKTIIFIPQTLTLTLAGLYSFDRLCGPIKIAPTMTLMEYTVTPAEPLKRTRKTIKINTKNTLDLYETTIRPLKSLRILTITMTII
jgi:hypothetical protein